MRARVLILITSLLLTGCPNSTDKTPADAFDALEAQDAPGGDLDRADDLTDGDVAADASEDPLLPMDEATAGALQAALEDFLSFSGDPMVTLAVRKGDGQYFAGASGVLDWETGATATADSQIRAGSSTKPFVAATVLQLVDEGLVDLDAPLTDYLPQYSQWENITTRHLLGMQSGLADYLNAESLWLDAFFSDKGYLTPDELVAYVADEPPAFQPGAGCAYNNTNYVLAGMLIEAVTGHSAVDEIHSRIIEPLGLSGTLMDVTGEESTTLAHGYTDIAIVAYLFGIPVEAASFVPEKFYYSETILDCTYLFHPSVTWTAGAMLTNAEDMVLFMRALMTGKILSDAALAEMMDFETCDLLGSTVQYGLGLMEYDSALGKAYGHGGLNFGYEAGTVYFKDQDLTVSHMHSYLPEQSAGLMEAVYPVLLGDTEVPAPCPAPEGFFADPEDGPVMHLSFKGPVNAQDDLLPKAGVAHIRGYTEEGDLPLYGLNTVAKRQDSAFAKRLQIESIAPSLGQDFQLRQGVLNMDYYALAALDETGIIELSADSPYQVYAAILDIAMNDALTEVTKVCIVAVPDFGRPSQVYVCDATSFTAEPGDQMRTYASVALTTDEEAVADYISMLKLSPCMCPDGEGGFGDCVAGE